MSFRVVAGGDFACFTRPEMKVERVSYEVMTPSAARGLLEAIFWKPAIAYRIQSITPLEPVRFVQLRRSEVKSKAGVPDKTNWKNGTPVSRIDVDAMEKGRPNVPAERTLRSTLALKDVAYLIEADFDLVRYGLGEAEEHGEHAAKAKYRDQIRRRINRGQCYRRPYLGCREFAAWFRPPEEGDTPALGTQPLGRMLFDIRFDPVDASVKDYDATPHFFSASLDGGVLHVPQEPYEDTIAAKH
jgi:CRISPR-associated protein Cas5d